MDDCRDKNISIHGCQISECGYISDSVLKVQFKHSGLAFLDNGSNKQQTTFDFRQRVIADIS